MRGPGLQQSSAEALQGWLRISLFATLGLLGSLDVSRAQMNESGDLSIELVDPKVLRVCADPRNMPFSNEKGEGFENKIAELFAEKLQKKLDYTYYPGATGFVRNTLGAHRCDVILGFPQGDDLAQGTNPYYRTAYAIITKQGSGLEDVTALDDPRLKDKHIGIVAGTPPATDMAVDGLMANAKPYPLMIDTRVDSSAEAMVNDLTSGTIDAGVLWGPMAGFYARKASPALHVTPLVKEKTGPKLVYRVGMGVRPADQNWKRQLNRLIQENQGAINKILLDFGVPLLDESDQPISAEAAAVTSQPATLPSAPSPAATWCAASCSAPGSVSRPNASSPCRMMPPPTHSMAAVPTPLNPLISGAMARTRPRPIAWTNRPPRRARCRPMSSIFTISATTP